MSYNILRVSADLGIKRVVQASSVNAIGMRGYSSARRGQLRHSTEEVSSGF